MESKPTLKIYNIQLVNEIDSELPTGQFFSSHYSSTVPVFKKLFIVYIWVFFVQIGLNSSIYAQNYLIVEDENLSIVSLITANGTRTVITLLLGYFMKSFALNWVMLIGTFFHVFFVIASFCPSYYTLIPGAIISGIGSCVTGIAAFVFMATLGKHYEASHKIDGYRIQTRIFLTYNVVIQCATILGYLLAYGMIGVNIPERITNGTSDVVEECGMDYCYSEPDLPKSVPSNAMQQYWLCGICLLCIMAAFMIILFLEPLTMKGQIKTKPDVSEFSNSRFNKLQFLLFPGNIITAVGSSFWFLDVTKAYELCLNGAIAVDNFGTYFLAFVGAAFLFGWFTKRCMRGQLGVFLLLKTCILLALMFYIPAYNNILLLFTALWAMSDGVLTAGFPAIYGEVCPANLTEAFTSQQFWTSFGLFLVDLLSIESCMSPKLYLHAAFSVLALVEFVLMEAINHKKQVEFQSL